MFLQGIIPFLAIRILKKRKEKKKLFSLKRERALLRTREIDRISNEEFKMNYRMTKLTFHSILEEVAPFLRTSRWSNRLTPERKLLITIRFCAVGSYQKCVGNNIDLSSSQPTVSKVIKEVVHIFNSIMCPKYIQFPSDEEIVEIKQWFELEYKLPNVIGVIDGTQIGIYPPKKDAPEYIYVNRKGVHSLNVQVVADHKYRIWSVNSKFAGSSHDSHVWRMSLLRDHLIQRYTDSNGGLEWLLGDSGYPLEPWLITPINGPDDDDEATFNESFCRARCLIERVIGILKARWRCLCKQRQLHYTPSVAGRIINTCVALHNLCIHYSDEYIFDGDLMDEVEFVAQGAVLTENNLHAIGEQRRNYIIAHLIH